jgi:hypothetical protein
MFYPQLLDNVHHKTNIQLIFQFVNYFFSFICVFLKNQDYRTVIES